MLDRQRLTQKNIAEIKYAKRFGYIFGIMLLFFGLLLDLYFIYELEKSTNWLIIYNISIIFISFLMPLFINKKYNNDLLYNEKTIKTDILRYKREEDSYEAGSGYPAPNALGMKKSIRYKFTIENVEYDVEKEIYNQVEIGDEVELHYALYSKMLLEITKKI